jgi:hypothetical protein
MAAIAHMALGVFGFGCEDALTHLLNYVWPNIFETSPHVVQAFMGAVEGVRVGAGAAKVLQYALQVTILLSVGAGAAKVLQYALQVTILSDRKGYIRITLSVSVWVCLFIHYDFISV